MASLLQIHGPDFDLLRSRAPCAPDRAMPAVSDHPFVAAHLGDVFAFEDFCLSSRAGAARGIVGAGLYDFEIALHAASGLLSEEK